MTVLTPCHQSFHRAWSQFLRGGSIKVFGLRGFYDTARIFYRPIHDEVVLPFESVPSVPRSEQV